jgi:hypothetical protein
MLLDLSSSDPRGCQGQCRGSCRFVTAVVSLGGAMTRVGSRGRWVVLLVSGLVVIGLGAFVAASAFAGARRAPLAAPTIRQAKHAIRAYFRENRYSRLEYVHACRREPALSLTHCLAHIREVRDGHKVLDLVMVASWDPQHGVGVFACGLVSQQPTEGCGYIGISAPH